MAMVLAASSYLMSEVSLQWYEDNDHDHDHDHRTSSSSSGDDDNDEEGYRSSRVVAVINLPRLLLWYADDFGSDLSSQMHRVMSMLPIESPVRSEMSDLLSSGTVVLYSDGDALDLERGVDRRYIKVQYNSYDWSFNGSTD